MAALDGVGETLPGAAPLTDANVALEGIGGESTAPIDGGTLNCCGI